MYCNLFYESYLKYFLAIVAIMKPHQRVPIMASSDATSLEYFPIM